MATRQYGLLMVTMIMCIILYVLAMSIQVHHRPRPGVSEKGEFNSGSTLVPGVGEKEEFNSRSTLVPVNRTSSETSLFSHDGIHHLSNVAVSGSSKQDTQHIYSAYYDTRPLSNRPAVVMLGYGRKSPLTMICKFKYDDNSTKCSGQPVIQNALIAPNVWPREYFCKLNGKDAVPSHVMLSAERNCNSAKWSHPIPVWNRNGTKPDGVGVCVHGCLHTTIKGDDHRILKLVMEFVAMTRALGAKMVTMYSLNLEKATLRTIVQLYPGFVDMVQWVDLNGTLHYYGQRVTLNDCIYRNMNRVKYLALIDLDEMILPVSSKSWPDMLQLLDKKGNHASFTFPNNFFEEIPKNKSDERMCSNSTVPNIFARLNKLPWPAFKENTKMKMIVKPALISASCIHDVCKPTVGGSKKTYWVPRHVALMAHYRVPVPKWYVYGKGVEDRTALKWQDQVTAEIRQKCSLLQDTLPLGHNQL